MKTAQTSRQRVVRPRSRASLHTQLQDLYARADMTVNLGLRMKQKLFGEDVAGGVAVERATPVCAEAYLAAIGSEISKANQLLEELNERVMAD